MVYNTGGTITVPPHAQLRMRLGGVHLIQVSRLNNEVFYVNPDLIEFIEETPDTVISMESGRKLVVSQSCAEITESIVQYRHRVLQGLTIHDIGGRT